MKNEPKWYQGDLDTEYLDLVDAGDCECFEQEEDFQDQEQPCGCQQQPQQRPCGCQQQPQQRPCGCQQQPQQRPCGCRQPQQRPCGCRQQRPCYRDCEVVVEPTVYCKNEVAYHHHVKHVVPVVCKEVEHHHYNHEYVIDKKVVREEHRHDHGKRSEDWCQIAGCQNGNNDCE